MQSAVSRDKRPDEPTPQLRPDYLTLRSFDRVLEAGDLVAFFIGALIAWRIGSPAPLDIATVAGMLLATFVFSRFLISNRVYKTAAHRLNVRVARRLITSLLLTIALATAVVFSVNEPGTYSREWLLAWLIAAAVLILAYRLLVVVGLNVAIQQGHLRRRVAIYGGDAQGVATIEHLHHANDDHYALVGFYDDRIQRVPRAIEGYERRGGLAELEQAVASGLVDEVIIALPLAAVERLSQIMNRMSRYSVTVLFAPDLAMWRFFDRPFEMVGQVPMLRAMEAPIEGWAGVAKFIEDRVIATLMLIAAGPLMALVALLIKLDSPGPVLFRQPRRGWNGGIFTIYKFRTMRTDVGDAEGADQAKREDPRVTRIGRFLRRTSIDELPQLFNVLRGDMSLVGPRPHALGTKAEGKPFDEAVADYMRRYRVKPGITGWAQVNGWRGETDTNRKLLVRVRYDMEYIENWTFWFDLYILLITPLSLIFRSRNAY